MSTIALDLPSFRARFSEFAATPDAAVTAQWGVAVLYVSPDTYGDMPVGPRTYALQLMTAHLLSIASASASGVTLQSKVGDVAVSLAQPPYGTSPWRYWLNLSPYGAALLALLDAQAAGGFYVGGLPERAAFRKVGGVW
jgi:hypothetical protein